MAHGRLIYPPGGGGGGAADGVNIIAAGSQTANSTGTVLFSNSNGVSFGMSNNSVITASVGAGAVGSISAGTTNLSLGGVSFVDSNNVSFGLNGSSITAQYARPRISAANGTFLVQNTLNFSDANGASWSTSAPNAIVLSYTVPSTAGLLSAVNLSAGTTSNNSSAVRFQDSNGVSFGLNAGTITATVRTDYLTSQSNQAFSASGGSSTFQTLSFNNANGATFSNVGGAVQLSYTVPSVPAQTNQTLGLYAVSNTTGASSSSTVDARSLSFQGAGIASVGYSGGSVVISVPSGGGAGDGVNILAAGSQTANTTGTVVFSNSNGVTFGMSNNSVITASVAAGGGSDRLYRAWEPRPMAGLQVMLASSLLLQRVFLPENISATVLDLGVGVSGSASAGATLTYTAAAYTMSGSTLSLASSGTVSYGYNSTAAASSYTALSATRYHSIPITWNMTPGEYMVGFIFNSTSSATIGTYSIVGNASQITLQQLPFGGGNRTYAPIYGVYSAATTAPPSSIHVTQVVQTSNVAIRPPWFALAGTF